MSTHSPIAATSFPSLSPIDVVTASAGTGKTYRLATAFRDAVAAGTEPGRILATTFTRKAAAELLERVRQRLIAEGHGDAARDVLTGAIGTVNAVFGCIAAAFALEAGRSPVADVIGEDRMAALFAAAADTVIRRHGSAIEPAAWRLRVEDWRDLVRRVSALARQNAIAPADLAASAARSLDGLLTLLPPPAADGAALDAALGRAVRDAVSAIEGGGEVTVKKTQDAFALLKEAAAALANGRPLAWADWVRLAKLDAGARWKGVAEAVVTAAEAHDRHPRLHADLRALVDGVFSCAAEAMADYAEFKRIQGLVDFVDQEQEALALLRRSDVRSLLAERFELALVDEFQDTSPIQLALFLELAGIVRRSVWVGDAKQAIYGFRGTDPDLIRAVVARVPPATGGWLERLPRSYRSRPGLVAFHNDLFGAAFPPTGIPQDQAIVSECDRSDRPGEPSPLEIWTLEGKNWDKALAALARGVANRLAAEGVDGALRGSDVAVLCRSNERCAAVAATFAAAGLKVAIGRSGLTATPEAGLALAALRYLVDPGDTLAMVELAHLATMPDTAEDAAAGQPDWLETWLAPDAARRAREGSPVLRALDAARDRLLHLTPVEALEVAIAAGSVTDAVLRWGGGAERLGNLDALRGLARAYEDDCRARRAAATAGGLIGFLSDAEKGGEQPPSGDRNAVQVMTYHQSKGLEWPMVVLLDLQGGPEPSAFGLTVEGPAAEDGAAVDPWCPLDGRWLRFWPWPYDKQRARIPLADATDAAPEMAVARRRAHAEAVRLMYVGMTRARDRLILAARPAKAGGLETDWLDALVDARGLPVLALPAGQGAVTVHAAGRPHPATAITIAAPEEDGAAPQPAAVHAVFSLPPAPAAVPDHPPLRLAPSHFGIPAPVVAAAGAPAAIALGDRLPLAGGVDVTRLGEAIHSFLAVDRPDAAPEDRLACAARLLERWGIEPTAAAPLVEAGDRLWRALSRLWPGAGWRTEVPVHGRLGLQRIGGRIDLLVDAADGVVIIDHKAFPGAFDQWAARALAHAPQLSLYRRMVEEATGSPVRGCFIHMPVVGMLLDLTRETGTREMGATCFHAR
ncbi:UvrD-helicase domain-containing protein [Azospirillum lipoferum]|uniref:DNA 3'-5' helicase n=1 Tax=Azospirillum lipoferum (strain 4B) TaxID=862719 RepID=G7Z8H9_AZOL4|nr:UvrD-helicase domain-containing protein [Azospirillum lipoferum]CBS87253.1 putative UvrD/REP helicase [Azospirillum lipoferum 4B]